MEARPPVGERYNGPPVVLASASPRRHELLTAMGVRFCVDSPDVPEASAPHEEPSTLAIRLSSAKATAVAPRHPDALVVGADTLVALDERVLGKPADEDEAVEMLCALRNRQHLVYTGLSVVNARTGEQCAQVAVTPVHMRAYSEIEVARYVASGDPMDKAGAYAIQADGMDPVDHIEWCYANVMGLPMCHLYRALRLWGAEAPIHPLDSCPFALRCGCPWAQGIIDEAVSAWCGPSHGDRPDGCAS